MNTATVTAEPGKQTILIERIFTASRDKVFAAFTQKEKLEKWWVGPGHDVRIEHVDARDGGTWRYIQIDDTGKEIIFHGSYHSVSPDCIIETFEVDGQVSLEKAVLTELPNGTTKLMQTSTFMSVADRDRMITAGMEKGLHFTYAKLDDVLRERQPMLSTRTFSATRDAVWDAWTQPDLFARWYAPDYFTIPVCEFDLRSEGAIRIDMQGPDGTVYPSSGKFKEVQKPERLVFTNSPLDADGKKLFEIQHTLQLVEKDEHTVLTLQSEVLSEGPNAAPYLAGMEMGLSQSLQKLESLLAE